MARTQKPQAEAPQPPALLAWHVQQKGDKSFWTKVGAAWPHKDRKGLTLQLETLPINGRIILREPRTETETGAGA